MDDEREPEKFGTVTVPLSDVPRGDGTHEKHTQDYPVSPSEEASSSSASLSVTVQILVITIAYYERYLSSGDSESDKNCHKTKFK